MNLLKRIAQDLQKDDSKFPNAPGFRGRDIYADGNLQYKAWEFCCRFWAPEIMEGLCGETVDGKSVPQQNIDSMLDQVEDLGEFTKEEWHKFFETIRVEGI